MGWGEVGGILNASKAKGTRWESSVRDFLNSTGQSAHRIAQAGADLSDVHLNGMWALQCKDVAQQRYAEWVPAARQQAANAALAVSTCIELRRQGWSISSEAIHDGLAELQLPARVEILSRNPTVVLDVAHNVASAEALVEVLNTSFEAGTRILILATSKDKDVPGIVRVLRP